MLYNLPNFPEITINFDVIFKSCVFKSTKKNLFNLILKNNLNCIFPLKFVGWGGGAKTILTPLSP